MRTTAALLLSPDSASPGCSERTAGFHAQRQTSRLGEWLSHPWETRRLLAAGLGPRSSSGAIVCDEARETSAKPQEPACRVQRLGRFSSALTIAVRLSGASRSRYARRAAGSRQLQASRLPPNALPHWTSVAAAIRPPPETSAPGHWDNQQLLVVLRPRWRAGGRVRPCFAAG